MGKGNIPTPLTLMPNLDTRGEQTFLNTLFSGYDISNTVATHTLHPDWQETLWGLLTQQAWLCVWNIDCRSMTSIMLSLQELAVALDIVNAVAYRDPNKLLVLIANHLTQQAPQTWCLVFSNLDAPDYERIQVLKTFRESREYTHGHVIVVAERSLPDLSGQPLLMRKDIAEDQLEHCLDGLGLDKATAKAIAVELAGNLIALRLFSLVRPNKRAFMRGKAFFLPMLREINQQLKQDIGKLEEVAAPLALKALTQERVVYTMRKGLINKSYVPVATTLFIIIAAMQQKEAKLANSLNQVLLWGNHVPFTLFSPEQQEQLNSLACYGLIIINNGIVSLRDPVFYTIFSQFLALEQRRLTVEESKPLLDTIDQRLQFDLIYTDLPQCFTYVRFIRERKISLANANLSLQLKVSVNLFTNRKY